MLSEVFVRRVEMQDSKIFGFTTCDIQPLPGSGMQELIREGSWRYWAIDVCKHRRATRTLRMMDYVEQLKTLTQRQKQTDAKVPTVSEQRPLLADANY